MFAGKWRKGGTRDDDELMAEAVKLLVCHVDMDGNTRTDTTMRPAAAAKAWSTSTHRIMRGKTDLSLKGRILEAVVLSKLFYSAEVRPFTAEEKRRYQVFINKIVAAIVWSETGIARSEATTMTMTHSEKFHICQMKAWPYRQECRGHDPTKKNLFCC